MKDNLKRIQIGLAAEEEACRYLSARGLRLIAKNFRCQLGEIDLIMQEEDEIVFVEVRVRNNTDFGTAIETVDYYKQAKLIRTAEYFLNFHSKNQDLNCRFDVIGICYVQTRASIEWIQDAFSVDNI